MRMVPYLVWPFVASVGYWYHSVGGREEERIKKEERLTEGKKMVNSDVRLLSEWVER